MPRELSARHLARIELVRHAVSEDDGLERAFLSAARLSAQTLKIARVGIWFFREERERLECRYAYHADTDRGKAGEVIELSSCPQYAKALDDHRIIMAEDAQSDPRTAQLAPYLTQHGITSLLDSPIFQQGEPVGVVCHEHVGDRRTWSKEDANFAATVSDMLGLYLEQDTARRYYSALLEVRRELERARAMESAGRLAAAVAHDFNNVLSALSMGAELLRGLKQPTESDIERAANETESLIDQGARLVQQLLDLSEHKPEPSGAVVDLVEVLNGLASYFRTLAVDGVRFDVRYPKQRVRVQMTRTHAEQIITNLAVNARDAMLGGGTLHIEAGCFDGEEGRMVFLRVADTGVGMDEHTAERIFEPYFTTKDEGQGHGLGLSTVYRIVQDTNGVIDVKSSPGAGTEFRIEWSEA